MGVVTPGRAVPGGVQLSLPLEAAGGARAARRSRAGSGCVADYGSIRISLAEHPLALLRADLPRGRRCRAARSSASRTAARSMVAGLVVARQRPATAKGVTFMLLEDEWGTINLVVAAARLRAAPADRPDRAVRARRAAGSSAARASINVVVDRLRALEQPGPPARRRQADRAARRTARPGARRSSSPRPPATCARCCRARTASAGARPRIGGELEPRLHPVAQGLDRIGRARHGIPDRLRDAAPRPPRAPP